MNGRDVYICFDSDVTQKQSVYLSMVRLKKFLEQRGARVRIIYLPPNADGSKVGLDDFFAAGHTVEELFSHATPELRRPPTDESHDGLPEINAGDLDLARVSKAALDALVKANDPPYLFVFGTTPMRLELGDCHGQ